MFMRCINTVIEQPEVGRRYARQRPSLQNHKSGMTPSEMLSQDNEFEQKGHHSDDAIQKLLTTISCGVRFLPNAQRRLPLLPVCRL
jgi:hypothetical protein